MKRILALLMAVLMTCTLFAGCGDEKAAEKPAEETPAVEVSDSTLGELTLEAYIGALGYADVVMQQNYGMSFKDYLDMDMGDGTTGADFLKENTEEMLREFESVKLIAEENGLEFSDDDKAKFDENKAATIESFGGQEAFDEQLKASGMNEAFFDYMTYVQIIYQKVYEELFTGEGKYALNAEGIVQKATDGGYIRVKHVLVQTAEDGSDVEAKKTLATEIAAKATAGEDFDALVKEYGEDPGMESYPHGYIINQDGYTTTGSGMVTEFTQASIALEVGGVSAPVQTSYGFHIIKRFPIDVESVNADFDAFSNEFSQLAVTEVLNEYLAKIENIEYPEGYDSIDIHAVFGVEKQDESAAAEGETAVTETPDDSVAVEVQPAEGGIEDGTAVTVTPEASATAEAQPAEGGIEVGTAVPVTPAA
ncbi:MAG: peptidylprolyl isomerase [Oscillospiraceae bacterium]|nr:peptidylprolyl isomerase [Oscillospiraceae bacterium]